MHEIRKNEEKEFVIFYEFIDGEQTEFIITRRNIGQITFRLLHQDFIYEHCRYARQIH
jgi:hypothetical protein